MFKTDLGDALSTLQGFVFTFHRGYRGTKYSNGILFNDKYYPTIEDFQKAVDIFIREGGKIIQNSIRHGNKKV